MVGDDFDESIIDIFDRAILIYYFVHAYGCLTNVPEVLVRLASKNLTVVGR